MKILMVNTVATEKNGITNVIMNIVSNINDEGVKVDLISINKPATLYYDILEQHGGKIFVLNRSRKKILMYVQELKRIIKKESYDVIHVHGNSHTVILELLAAKLAGCTVRIAHAHNTTCRSHLSHLLFTPFFNFLCTHRLACGQDAGRFMHGRHEFVVVNNGVDTKRFSFCPEARQKIRVQYGVQDKIVIGHVGMFNVAKNQLFLLEVLKSLLSRNEQYCLMLLGEGERLQAVEHKAIQLGIRDSVFFVGGTDNVPEYLSAMDFIMMPSLFEGLPLTLIEEQASGLICLVSDRIAKEADKTGNLLFLPLENGPEAWVETVEKLNLTTCRINNSKVAIQKIKACGYSIENEAQKLKQYYVGTVQTNCQ